MVTDVWERVVSGTTASGTGKGRDNIPNCGNTKLQLASVNKVKERAGIVA